MSVFVFPGQGSQKLGMGGDLFKEFVDLTAICDKILNYSIEELCIEDKNNHLNLTQYTQPALFIVNAFTFYKKMQTSSPPLFVAGHSLGEFNALLASGVFDFETGLKLVQKRGELMSQAKNGAMAAVIGLQSAQVLEIIKSSGFKNVSIANFNSYTQTIITGLEDEVVALQDIFLSAKANFIKLNVSGAFHSKYMQPAKEVFAEFLNNFTFNEPKISVIANINAKPYTKENISYNIAEQMTHSVQWLDTILYLQNNGQTIFEEIGPGSVLTGLIRRINKKS